MVAPKTSPGGPAAACSAITVLVLENGELRKEVKRLRHHVLKLAKKLHRNGVELEERGERSLVSVARGEKEEVAEVVAAEVVPITVAVQVPEPVVAEPLVADEEVEAWVVPVLVVEVPESEVAEPPEVYSVMGSEEEEEFDEARVVLPAWEEVSDRERMRVEGLMGMAEELEDQRGWKMVERGVKKRKVDMSLAPVGPRLWRGSGAVEVLGGNLDVVPTGPRATRNYVRAWSEGPSLGVRGGGPVASPLPRVQ